jgi:outer membrane protein
MNGPLPGVLLCAILVPAMAWGQAAPSATPRMFTLEEALQYALEHYPTVRVAIEEVNALTPGVSVAKAAYLPRLDGLWQSQRATVNNTAGQLLPQSVIPSMSGPVPLSISGQSVWGSAAGALFSWEPFDFGLRRSTVASAEAAVARARAAETLTRLEVQQAVGEAFLAVVSAERAVAAAEGDVSRRDVLARAAQVLADNQLRPGAEASRANAERVAAQTRLIRAQQNRTLARSALARLLGVPSGDVGVDALTMVDELPPSGIAGTAPDAHPLTKARQAAVDLARSREDELTHADRPRVYVQSSVFARGSGAEPDGHLSGGLEGLAIDRPNWAAGVQVVFPNVFDFSSLSARKAASAAATRSEIARYDETLLLVSSQQRDAAAIVQAARAIAANTPVQLAAARQSEAQARARYEAGLASIVEVADAQDLLTQAEYQDQIARVDVWRALLSESVAAGDLGPFVSLVHPSQGAR